MINLIWAMAISLGILVLGATVFYLLLFWGAYKIDRHRRKDGF